MIAVCADVGSTYTKVAAVDLASGALLATAEHPTTSGTDVLHGLDAAIAQVVAPADISTILVCSSAGGGLRLAVVGYEPLVTAEAGRRVGLSAGAKVVHVTGGRLDRSAIAALRADRPDIVLLVGGTDGGDEEVLRHNGRQLAAARLTARRARIPIVVAGNTNARDDVAAELAASGAPVVACANVLPRIGELNPDPARAAIRAAFLRHVIGGKGLSRGPRFGSLVRAATPDAVLTGVALLAAELGGDLAVVDVGGATTDVYSILAEQESVNVAGTLWHARTVEADLGVRWSAPGVVTAAQRERLAPPPADEAAARAAVPGLVPASDAELSVDAELARLAAVLALRRHGRERDLTGVRLLVGSGGVLRHARPGVAEATLAAVLRDTAGGWRLPRAAGVAVDRDYRLAPAGLLAGEHPAAARALLRPLLLSATEVDA